MRQRQLGISSHMSLLRVPLRRPSTFWPLACSFTAGVFASAYFSAVSAAAVTLHFAQVAAGSINGESRHGFPHAPSTSSAAAFADRSSARYVGRPVTAACHFLLGATGSRLSAGGTASRQASPLAGNLPAYAVQEDPCGQPSAWPPRLDPGCQHRGCEEGSDGEQASPCQDLQRKGIHRAEALFGWRNRSIDQTATDRTNRGQPTGRAHKTRTQKASRGAASANTRHQGPKASKSYGRLIAVCIGRHRRRQGQSRPPAVLSCRHRVLRYRRAGRHGDIVLLGSRFRRPLCADIFAACRGSPRHRFRHGQNRHCCQRRRGHHRRSHAYRQLVRCFLCPLSSSIPTASCSAISLRFTWGELCPKVKPWVRSLCPPP